MSPRTPGRRIAERPHPEPGTAPSVAAPRTVVVAAASVVVLGSALAWAGTASAPSPHRSQGISRTTPVARDFSCVGGLPGASATAGVAGESTSAGLTVDDAARGRATRTLSGRPTHVHADAAVAARAFAVRTAKAKHWFAAGSCPSPRATWWFVGVGGSGSHHSELTMADPRKGDAIVDIEVFGPHGPVEAPGLQDVRISSGGVTRFDLSKVAPAVGDLAVRVVASRGLVSASVADTWSAGYVGRPVRDWVTEQPVAGRRVTIAGLPARDVRAGALVANPSMSEAVVRVSLLGADGAFAPTSHAAVRIPPQSVHRIRLAGMLKAQPRALRLESQVPVSATVRVRRDTDAAYLPVVVPLSGSSVVGVPAHEGSASLVLIGGKLKTSAGVTVFSASGRALVERTLPIGASATTTFALPKHAASVQVRGATVAGALLLGEDTKHSLAVLPLTPTGSEARVPAIRPGW